jgi:site-specific DNA-methyltransferase (adenine-specific)
MTTAPKDSAITETADAVGIRSSALFGLRPYHEEAAVTIYHGDCREIIPMLGMVDAVVTDWPYGVNMKYGAYDDTDENLDSLIADVFPLMVGAAKRTCFTCGVLNQWKYPRPNWGLCLYSANSNGSGPWGFTCWQPVLCYGKDPYLQNGKGRQPDALCYTNLAKSENDHPCPKPLKLWSWVVNRCTMPGETILDPFAGSGTTGRAAKDLGRKAILIEREERFCEMAALRLAQDVLPFDCPNAEMSHTRKPEEKP